MVKKPRVDWEKKLIFPILWATVDMLWDNPLQIDKPVVWDFIATTIVINFYLDSNQQQDGQADAAWLKNPLPRYQTMQTELELQGNVLHHRLID